MTKNGYDDMVVMSIEQFEVVRTKKRIDSALLEAQKQAVADSARLDFEDVSLRLRKKLVENVGEPDA